MIAPTGWQPGKHSCSPVPDGQPPQTDSLSTQLRVLRYAPGGIKLDRRWTRGILTGGQRSASSFSGQRPRLSGTAHLRHRRAVRAIATMITKDRRQRGRHRRETCGRPDLRPDGRESDPRHRAAGAWAPRLARITSPSPRTGNQFQPLHDRWTSSGLGRGSPICRHRRNGQLHLCPSNAASPLELLCRAGPSKKDLTLRVLHCELAVNRRSGSESAHHRPGSHPAAPARTPAPRSDIGAHPRSHRRAPTLCGRAVPRGPASGHPALTRRQHAGRIPPPHLRADSAAFDLLLHPGRHLLAPPPGARLRRAGTEPLPAARLHRRQLCGLSRGERRGGALRRRQADRYAAGDGGHSDA